MSGNQCASETMEPQTVHTDDGIRLLYDLDREQLVQIIIDDAKNWLAHDGLWFQALEKSHGMETAMDADREAWRQFTVVEAKRIMGRLGLKPGGGIPALVECLRHRFYARLNLQKVMEVSDTHAIFWMVDCRVQSARQRKGLPAFPCKTVGIVEYAEFARTIDPRITTRCIGCPPDPNPGYYWCSWEFSLEGDPKA
jgi:hypothetical protein